MSARSILQCALLHLRYLDDALVVRLKLPSPQAPTSHIRRRSALPDSSYRYALNSRCLLHFALETTLTNGTYAAAALSRNPHSISKTEHTCHLTPYKHALPTSNGLSRGVRSTRSKTPPAPLTTLTVAEHTRRSLGSLKRSLMTPPPAPIASFERQTSLHHGLFALCSAGP